MQFGVTGREATTRLTSLRKNSATSLAEHVAEVKLVNMAYPDVPVVHRRRMGLDRFHITLGSAYFQRHLLAVPPDTVEATVRAGNEFLQVKMNPSTHGQVRLMEGSVKTADNRMAQSLAAITKLMEEVTARQQPTPTVKASEN